VSFLVALDPNVVDAALNHESLHSKMGTVLALSSGFFRNMSLSYCRKHFEYEIITGVSHVLKGIGAFAGILPVI
jgi:hypothetical protein